MSISLSRLRDTRIEEDSDNSTSYKCLFVRNVFDVGSASYLSSRSLFECILENIPHEEVFRGM